MARPRRCRRAVWNSLLLSSRALESGRVSSQADAGRQAQLRSRARAVLRAVLQGGQQGVSVSLGRVPAVGALCLCDGAHAVLADHPVLRPPKGLRLVMQAFPLWAKLCTARAIEWTELCGPMEHSKLGGGDRREVCGIAFLRASVRQAQAAVAHGKGELVLCGPSMQACAMMAKAQSSALLLARSTVCATRVWRLP
jgi:hypothetical protein